MLLIILAIFVFGLCIYWVFASPYSQLFGRYPYRARTSKRVVALTFDDGPNEPYTSQIVNYLNAKDIHATFFQVGKCVERFPQVSKTVVKAGHVIANHSLSHKFSQYFIHPSFMHEIVQNQGIITRTTGKTPALYRSPWLWRQPLLLRTLEQQKLHPVSGVFCHFLEPWQPSAQRIAKSAIRKTKPGTILIFHDGVEARGGDRRQTVEAVKITVEALLNKGYQFVTVSELLAVPAYL